MLTSCDVGQRENEPLNAPSVHLLSVELFGLDANGQPATLTLTPSAPVLPDTSQALTTTSLRLTFDRFLLPGDAIRQSICLQPTGEPVTTAQDCKLGVFLEPSYDPVRHSVTYRLTESTKLVADTRYWLTVISPNTEAAQGIRAFDGAPLEANVTLQFTTALMDPSPDPVDPALSDAQRQAVSEELFCKASACVAACGADANCATICPVANSLPFTCGGCHSAIENGNAAMGLDLSAGNRIEAIISTVAHQTQTGEQADEPDLKPRRLGRAMPQIDPGNAGNSYLLYKILITQNYAATDAGKTLAAGELERLRESVVVGLPMPPSSSYLYPLTSLDALSGWIVNGAQTPACP